MGFDAMRKKAKDEELAYKHKVDAAMVELEKVAKYLDAKLIKGLSVQRGANAIYSVFYHFEDRSGKDRFGENGLSFGYLATKGGVPMYQFGGSLFADCGSMAAEMIAALDRSGDLKP